MSNLTCATDGLQLASFRGVSFWVENDKEAYGRRVKTHEYPKGDVPYNEDMGEKAQDFHVTGYVAGDGARGDKEALVAACRQKGSALLVMPAKDPFQAVCLTLTVTRSKEKQGFFELVMEFKADPGAGSPLGIPVFESLISGVLGSIAPALTAAYDAAFSAINVLPYVASNAVTRIQAFASIMQTAIEATSDPTSDVTSRAITNTIGLYQSAATLVRPSPDAAGVVTDCAATVGSIFVDMMNTATPETAAVVLAPLATLATLEATDATGAARYGAATPIVIYAGDAQAISQAVPVNRDVAVYAGSAIAPSISRDAANAAAFNGMVRSYALVALAQAVAASTYTDRQTAIQTRANLVELFDQQLERTVDYDIAVALTTARDYAITALTQDILSVIPVVTVEAPVTLPNLYWAARLYNDCTRAQELSDRNKVPTAAYMPQRFEALAS